MIGIYAFRSKVTDQYYVGSSVHIESRKKDHDKALLRKRHHSAKLQVHVNTHGLSDLEFIVLQLTKESNLEELERFYINKLDSFNNGFNCTINTKRFSKKDVTLPTERYTISDEARLGIKYSNFEGEISRIMSKIDASHRFLNTLILSDYVNTSGSYFDCLCRTNSMLTMIDDHIERKQKLPKKNKKFTLVTTDGNIFKPCHELKNILLAFKSAFQKKEPTRFINLGLS